MAESRQLRGYTYPMSSGIAVSPINVAAVQAALTTDGIDGWLLYDFRGLNPIGELCWEVSRAVEEVAEIIHAELSEAIHA